jgi:hypothetical protein
VLAVTGVRKKSRGSKDVNSGSATPVIFDQADMQQQVVSTIMQHLPQMGLSMVNAGCRSEPMPQKSLNGTGNQQQGRQEHLLRKQPTSHSR